MNYKVIINIPIPDHEAPMNGAEIMSRTKKAMIVTIVAIFIALVLTPIVAIQANKYIYKIGCLLI